MLRCVFLILLCVVPTNPRLDDDKGEYQFFPSLLELVVIQRGDYYYFGKLDKNGDFTPSEDIRRRSIFDKYSGPLPMNKPRWGAVETVYEFRSGFLIRGTL